MDKPSRVAITHPKHGIYLGSWLGLGFWSKMDGGGQEGAVTFASEADAREYMSSWDEGSDIKTDLCRFVTIFPSDDIYATIPDLIAAGLRDDLGDLLDADADAPDPAPQLVLSGDWSTHSDGSESRILVGLYEGQYLAGFQYAPHNGEGSDIWDFEDRCATKVIARDKALLAMAAYFEPATDGPSL